MTYLRDRLNCLLGKHRTKPRYEQGGCYFCACGAWGWMPKDSWWEDE